MWAPFGICIMLTFGVNRADPCPAPCYCIDTTVYCNGTGITSVPTNIPQDTTSLNLADNNIRPIGNDSFFGLQNLMFLDISNNGLVHGDIENGAFTQTTVTHITFAYNRFTQIPHNFPKNIVALTMADNALRNVTTDAFDSYRSLVYLELSGNDITDIEEGAFEPLGNLNTLYMEFVELSDEGIPNNFLKYNKHLQILRLKFNKLETVPDNLPASLISLDLTGNDIQSINQSAFQGLSSLITVVAAQSGIKEIADMTFRDLQNVVLLEFSHNALSSLTSKTFYGLFSLQSLYLGQNNISNIHSGAFTVLSNLTTLDISDNKMTSLPPEVLDTQHLGKLHYVYLSGNYWFCDCHLRWLREKMDSAQYVIVDRSNMECYAPEVIAGKKWLDLKPSDFVC